MSGAAKSGLHGQPHSRNGSWAEASFTEGRDPASHLPALLRVVRDVAQDGTDDNFRAEATLAGTPVGNEVAPASLPQSSAGSRGSDDGQESNPVKHSKSAPAQGGRPGSAVRAEVVSLPGALDDTDSSASALPWEPGASMALSPSSQRVAARLLPRPDSYDFLFEEAEIEKLSQSPDFFTERARDAGFTMLHFVAMLGHKTLAGALQAVGAGLHHRFARIARCLIVRHNHKVYTADKYGCTPLQLAAACGNIEMVKVLLEPYDMEATGEQVLDEADSGYEYINHQDEQINFSALHGAVSHNEYDVVILLLKHGANPQVLDVTRSTAFKAAPTLASLQELLRLVVHRADEVPRPVIVQLMAEVLDKQVKESGGRAGPGGATGGPAAAAQNGGKAAGGGGGTELHDVKVQRKFKAHKRWSKAAQYVSFKNMQVSDEPAQRFGAAALEMVEHVQGADVAATIKRHFGELYAEGRYGLLVKYVITSISSNHDKLTEIMIDLMCNDCPDVLADPRWHETLEPLVCSYPTLFHRLLYKLQDMRDEDVRGFVRCLSPAQFLTSTEARPQSAAPGGSQRMMAGARAQSAANTASQRLGTRSHAADRVKLLIYQQLVEGLKQVSYRVIKTFFEEADEKLLNDMAQFPIFAEFVGLVANMQTAKAFDESDSSRLLLLELLRSTPYDSPSRRHHYRKPAAPPTSPPAAAPRPPTTSPTTLPSAWASVPKRTIMKKTSSKVSFALDVRGEELSFDASPSLAPARGKAAAREAADIVAAACAAVRPSDSSLEAGAAAGGRRSDSGGGAAGGSGGSGGGGGKGQQDAEPGGGGGGGEGGDAEDATTQRARLSLQTLNVHRVLWAAVRAGKAYNVETAVMSIISWVETNSKEGKAVFLSGITPDLIKELAMRFPSACATLLNLVSRDVLEQLTTLQVSANVLYGKDHLVKCSHVRNHFTWREHELRKLLGMRGYDEAVVDALVDYGVPFECVYKAAVEMGSGQEEFATPAQFASLIEHEFSGPEIKQLISNGIRLAKVIGYIEECSKPPPEGIHSDFVSQLDVPIAVLLRDMLREKLSPRIVDIILREEKMFETTKYNNFRPGRPLRKMYPEKLFVPTYTHHFVQMLLINWRRGAKNDVGKVTLKPWAKEFIDTIFEPNDPLFTKLKSSYDNRLTDTQVYIQGDQLTEVHESKLGSELREQQARQEREQEQREQREHVRQLLRVFVSHSLLVHRWPIYLLAQLWLLVHGFCQTYWQRLEDVYYREKARRFGHQVSLAKKARSGTIDAAALSFPILGFVQPPDGDILTALVDADAPSSWFHYAIVRALYGLHWTMFGRVMILLSAAAQLQLMLTFLVFFLLVLYYRPAFESDPNSLQLAHLPVIQGMLCTSVVLSASMLAERVQEAHVPQLGTWVFFGRQLELCCHAMVWIVAIIVWTGQGGNLVPAVSGLTMLLFVGRLTLFGLVTEKLSTAVLALLEILSDSRYFFLLIGTVYAGFILAVAGLRDEHQRDPTIYSSQLFTVLLGDFQSSTLSEERTVWRFPDFSLILLSIYAVLMLIVFMNLLIATMNDTYDRVKEFREVEVMRLRSHMMVFVKHFIKSNAQQKLATLDGDVLHLLLRPEEVKSGRWLSQSGSDPTEYNAWAGRITYMRSTIVREVEGMMRANTDKTLEQLGVIEQRLDQVEHGMAALTVNRLSALERRLDGVDQGMATLLEPSGGT